MTAFFYIPPRKRGRGYRDEAGYKITEHDVSTVRIESTRISGYGWGMLTPDGVEFASIDNLDWPSAQIPERVRDAICDHFDMPESD